MRALISIALAASLLASPSLSHAQHRSTHMAPVIASMGPMGVEIARLHSGSRMLAMPVILGGFSSGGGGSSSFTSSLSTSALAGRLDFTNATSGATNISEIRSSAADAAASVALRIAAGADYTTSGSKLLSVGDNAAAAYSEKAYVGLDGTVNIQGDYVVGNGRGLIGLNGTTRQFKTGYTAEYTGVTGVVTDGATAVAVRIAAEPDYTAAGAKLLSVGDNAGSSYAEKFAIHHDGVLLLLGGSAPDSGSTGIGGATTTIAYNVASATGTHAFTINGGNGATVSAIAANGTGHGGQINLAHISGSGGSTTGAALGTGCGTSSAATQAGNDIGGTLGATCGTAGTAANPIVTVTFADAYNSAPFCTVTPRNAASAAVAVSAQIIPVTTTTTLAINCGGGTCPTGTLLWAYHCTQ